jgi:hypothetical protein
MIHGEFFGDRLLQAAKMGDSPGRTSGAKALIAVALCGTAKPVPFVQ